MSSGARTSPPVFTDREKIHEGTHSLIYRARRQADGLPVVLKVLRGAYPSTRRLARFRREYETTARMKGEHVVRALELAEVDDSLAIVLEDAGGGPLAAELEGRPLPVATALRLGIQIADALAEIHQEGVVHKDVNPANLVWSRDAQAVKLIDFGISAPFSRETREEGGDARKVEGTFAYLSPEQTGRMNRAIDHRSDLYSLGATLYELLTGHPPFESEDPLELVHAHMALSPAPPHERNAQVPEALSAVVLKLLRKAPEERYQSAFGIKADLERCLEALDAGGAVEPFAPGADDAVTRPQLPRKLYGRRSEVEALGEAFERVADGGFEVVLVEGYSGVGKTSLVRALQGPVVARGGSFVSGKFGQLRRDIPYTALIQAFRQFARQVLADSDEQILAWKGEISRALGRTGQALVNVIPELELVIGPQPPLSELGPHEAENRFHEAFRRFVRCIASAEHPLAVFLDDLQWADQASIRLLERLATDTDARHLLILGAYRVNEVGASHPLMLAAEEIRERGTRVQTIALAPLRRIHVRHLVADMQRRPVEEVRELADLCFEKTRGNPFFLNQFVQGLFRTGLLRFDARTGRFDWEIAEIEAQQFTDNVVEFMAERTRSLPAETRDALGLAACLGSSFALADLRRISGQGEPELRAAFEPCLRDGMLATVAEAGGAGEREAGSAGQRLGFTHDGVQQAAYGLIPEKERPQVHLRVGRALLAARDAGEGPENDEDLFHVANHLNRGLALIDAQAERDRLAELNSVAGAHALESGAHGPARTYLDAGLRCLDEASWSRRYSATLGLHLRAAQAAYLGGDFEEMQRLIDRVLAQARDVMDEVRAYQIRLAADKARNDPLGALETARIALGLIGVRLPERAGRVALLRELLHTRLRLRKLDVAELPPLAENEPLRAAMHILADVTPAVYYARPDLMPLVVFRLVSMSVAHGVVPASSYGFVVYGLILCTLGDIDRGYRLGEMAVRLAERLGDRRFLNITRHLFNTHVRFWKDHFELSTEVEREVYQAGIEAGDSEYAAFGAYMHCYMQAQLGRDLQACDADSAVYAEVLRTLGQETPAHQHAISWQYVQNLLGKGNDPVDFAGPAYDERRMVSVHEAAADKTNLFIHATTKLQVAVFFDEPEVAMRCLEAAAPHQAAASSSIVESMFVVFGALAELLRSEQAPAREARRLRRSARRRRKRIALWARTGPENFEHLLALVDAELARGAGREQAASTAYDRAIDGARGNGFVAYEALAAERAARFYFGRGSRRLGRAYLQEARHAYARWGAHAKGERLDREFQEQILQLATAQRMVSTATATSSGGGERLDLQTVMKASQAISEQIVLGRLLEELMGIVLENAGAQRGSLVLLRDDELRVEAQAATDRERVDVGCSIALREAPEISPGVVNYVVRTGEAVVLADAGRSGEFVHDPYVARTRPRSVLCMPIVYQGDVGGALYLENNLAAGAFTPGRLETLRMLAGQAAISIENASLYDSLGEKVRERTEELELRNRFIRSTFGRYVSSDVVDSLLATPERLELGGENRIVTIMMADLRGFSSLSEGLPPEKVVSVINNFFSVMTEVITHHRGVIDDFFGDAILVFFGAPVLGDDDAERAVACAVEMQLAMEEVNRRNAELGLPTVEMGIGINTGEVVAGNIGSERRAKYGVVGSNVNLSARIEGYTVGGEILISKATLEQLDAELEIGRTLDVSPKGFTGSIQLHSVTGIGAPYGLALPDTTDPPLKLTKAVPVQYVVLGGPGGKDARGEAHAAELTAVSQHHAELRSARAEPVLADLKIRFEDGEAKGAELYAKVTGEVEEGFTVRFTTLPEAVRLALESSGADPGGSGAVKVD